MSSQSNPQSSPSATTKTLEDIEVWINEPGMGELRTTLKQQPEAIAAINNYTREQINEAKLAAWQSFVITLQYRLEPRYGETVEETVKHWKKQAEKVLESLKGGIDG